MKDCPTCETPRDESEFVRNRSRPDGLHGECRHCHNDRNREYQRRPEVRERRRIYFRRRYRERKAREAADGR